MDSVESTIIEYTKLKYDSNNTIKYAYHISDIHIRLQSRHQEYHKIFESLFTFLKNEVSEKKLGENKSSSAVIVITGDILHSKCELTPEAVEITRLLFTKLAKIIPVIAICGNHDINIHNDKRLDAITPIANGVSKSLPFYYLKKTGVYQLNNILFSVASVFDYQIINPTQVISKNVDFPTEECLKICLFHGRVDGVLLNNGTKIDGEVNTKTNKTITVSSFNGYDYGLFGDIHKHQYLNEDKTIAYAGSLIQQSHGETIDKHGILVWDFVNKDSSYHHINNDDGFITLSITSSNTDNIKCIHLLNQEDDDGDNNYGGDGEYNYDEDEEDHCKKCDLPKNIYLRLMLNDTPNSFNQKFISKLKINHNIKEITFQDNTKTADSNVSKNIRYDITNSDYQNSLLDEILKGFAKTDNNITSLIIDQIKKLNKAANESLENNNEYHNSGTWKILKMEFDNLYSYGPRNVINFANMSKTVGLIAENHMGKSAILDIILYTLFDKFPRKGTIKDIINNRKHEFMSRITIQIGEWHYIIEKKGMRNKKGGTTSKCEFHRFHPTKNIRNNLSEDSMPKTKSAILKYIGSYEDIIQTNFSLQHNNCNFIDAENTERKKELERILRINFIDELIKKASKEVNNKKAVINHLINKCPSEKVIEITKIIKEQKLIITENDKENTSLVSRKDELIKEITLLNQKLILGIDEKLNKLIGNDSNDSNDSNNDELLIDNENAESLIEYANKELQDIKKIKVIIENNLGEEEKIDKEDKIEKTNTLSWYQEEINKHQSWESEKLNKIKSYDEQIENILSSMENINQGGMTIEYIKNSINDFQINIDEMKTKIKKKTKNVKKLERIDAEILEIQDSLVAISANSMPEELVNIVEETDIYGLENQINDFCKNIASDTKNNDYQSIKETDEYSELTDSMRKVEMFNYLAEYEIKMETLIDKRKNNLTKLEGLKVEKKSLEKDREKLAEYQVKLSKFENNLQNILEKKKDIEKFDNTKIRNQEKEIKLTKVKERKIKIQESIDNEWVKAQVIKGNLDKLNDINIRMDKCQLKIDKYQQNQIQITELIEQKKKNVKIEEELEELEGELEEVSQEIVNTDGILNNAKSKFVANNTQLINLKNDIEIIDKTEKEIQLFLIYINALKEIPYIMINKIKNVLETKVNAFLSVITNFVVKFEIENTRIDIYLDRPIYEGKLILLNNSSGFERFISSLAIRLALLEISQLPKANFMAIDEGWNAFDYNNINNVRSIFEFLETKFDFIISISHIQSIKQYCKTHINLSKDDKGFSKVNVK